MTGGVVRRVPIPVLRPGLDVCKPTGVTLGAGRRIAVLPDAGGVGKSLISRLEKHGCEVITLDPAADREAIVAPLSGGTVHGLYWLAGLDDEGPLDGMGLEAWHAALELRVKKLYAVTRALYDQEPFVVAATRLGGYHGYDEAGALAPLGGAITGFVKAYGRERPGRLVKAVDFAPSRKTGAIADTLIGETLRDPGCVEVGHTGDLRWTVGFTERPFGDGSGGLTLGRDTVFAVTGAAGGIVSAITTDLAKACGGVFHLLDLTPEPDADDPDLRRYATDPDGLRDDITERLKASGERPTPVRIEKELARYERLHTALSAIQAIRDAGGTAHYHAIDLTDPEAAAATVAEIKATSGRIDVLLHAAGLEISRALPDKEPHEFDLVFDVKSDGWFNLMRAAGDLPIGATVAFSSVAGRFGNAGQTDYSAANDLLCKLTSGLRRTRPQTRGIALDWSAWAGIGMASRGSIPKIMEMAGIEMITPETGVPWIRHELTCGDDRGEVIVAGALGVLGAELDEAGGLDPSLLPGAGPMTGSVQAAGVFTDGLVVRTTLDPAQQPFLDDHRIDGTPVLPGVMGIEAFAEVAALAAPGRHVTAIEDVDFLAPLKFYRDEPRTVTLRTTVRPDGDDLLAECALDAERTLPGSAEPQRTTHFTAKVRLSREPAAPEHQAPAKESGPVVQADDVYRLYFHGPAYQVVAAAWREDGGVAARLADGLPPAQEPAEPPAIAAPRLVELCFQAAGLKEAAEHGRLALPRHVDRVRLLPPRSGPAYARVRPREDGYDCVVLDADGTVVVAVEGYATVPLPQEVPGDIRSRFSEVI